jgi:hypothetical protein
MLPRVPRTAMLRVPDVAACYPCKLSARVIRVDYSRRLSPLVSSYCAMTADLLPVRSGVAMHGADQFARTLQRRLRAARRDDPTDLPQIEVLRHHHLHEGDHRQDHAWPVKLISDQSWHNSSHCAGPLRQRAQFTFRWEDFRERALADKYREREGTCLGNGTIGAADQPHRPYRPPRSRSQPSAANPGALRTRWPYSVAHRRDCGRTRSPRPAGCTDTPAVYRNRSPVRTPPARLSPRLPR